MMTSRKDAGLPPRARGWGRGDIDVPREVSTKRWPWSVLLVWLLVFGIGAALATALLALLTWILGGDA